MTDQFWKKCVAVLLVAFMSVASLTACETTEGVGEDIEEAGEEIDEEL